MEKKDKSKENKHKLPSLRIILVFLIAACWLIPIGVFSYFIFNSYQNAYIDKTEKLIMNGVNVSGVLVATKIDDGIRLMQKPTYEGHWENYYTKYEKGEISRAEYLAEIKASLKSKFYSDSRFSSYAFYIVGEETACSYSEKSDYNYQRYVEDIQPTVKKVIEKDSNYVEVHVIDNTIYLIRNLYTVNQYRKYGTLVVALKTEELFKEMPMEKLDNVIIDVNQEENPLVYHKSGMSMKEDPLFEEMKALYGEEKKDAIYTRSGDTYNGFLYQNKYDNYEFMLYYRVNHTDLYESLYQLNKIVFIILFALIPFIVLSYLFLTKQIEIPLRKLVAAAKKISDGKFGSVVEGKGMPNEEFACLTGSFNSMSVQVKYLFDSVYNEQIARKDAQIAALQAQINPHFLNNTLEMMNWQARMNNDIETSKMIEALGTVLDFSMNRSNDKEIYLSEELRCADSFLYIMSMRFGQRLKVERVIDKYLMQTYVPQLILQPLLENAIKHGIEQVNSGIIYLNIYKDDTYRYIDVINTGKCMSDEEQKKINQIIDGSYVVKQDDPNQHTSIGIYNVNKRIKLMYGNAYGLQIYPQGEDKVVSRITLPIEHF